MSRVQAGCVVLCCVILCHVVVVVSVCRRINVLPGSSNSSIQDQALRTLTAPEDQSDTVDTSVTSCDWG